MISDLCDRGECETCFEDEIDACGHECHPADSLAGVCTPKTEQPSTGGARQAQDPADGLPRSVRVAQATMPGEPAVRGAPHGTAGGKTSPQPSERQAAGRPDPGTGEADPGIHMPASPGRGRTRAPTPITPAARLDRAPATGRVPGKTPAGASGTDSPPAGSTGRTWTLELPAGMELLSLNGREHWAARNRKTQALKQAAWVLAKRAKIPRLKRASITVEYQPPDRRRRDADNTCAASGKACADGLVAAGVLLDDECPRYVAGIWCTIGELYPKGRLVLHLTELATGGDVA